MAQESQEAVQTFINHHAMSHAGSATGWNLPFCRVDALEWFKYDAVMLAVILLSLMGLAVAVRRSYGAVPRGIAAIIEMFVLFVRDKIVYESMGKELGQKHISFFCSLFIFILCGNLLGLIPLFGSATGCASVATGLSTIFVVVAFRAVIKTRGLVGVKDAFVPHGLGWAAPLMAFMEIISFSLRVLSLTIRLFCNMLAGHIVIYSLLGMFVILGWIAFPFLLLTVAMYFFELFMAFLQAYIFTLLSAIFIGMMVNPEH